MNQTTKLYIEKMANAGYIDKKKLKEFVEKYNLLNKKITDINDIIRQLPEEDIAKYMDEINILTNAAKIYNLENKIGSGAAYAIVSATEPAFMKTIDDFYSEVTSNPQFKKYFENEKQNIQQDYELQKEYNQKQLEFTQQDIALQKDIQEKMLENYKEQIEKYINYAKDDYIQNLRKVNIQLDQAMQQATEAYGMKNMLNSGFYRQLANSQMQTGETTKTNLETDLNRKIDEYNTKLKEEQEKYENTIQQLNLNLQKAQYNTSYKDKLYDINYQRDLEKLQQQQFTEGLAIAQGEYQNYLDARRKQVNDLFNTYLPY